MTPPLLFPRYLLPCWPCMEPIYWSKNTTICDYSSQVSFMDFHSCTLITITALLVLMSTVHGTKETTTSPWWHIYQQATVGTLCMWTCIPLKVLSKWSIPKSSYCMVCVICIDQCHAITWFGTVKNKFNFSVWHYLALVSPPSSCHV